MGLRMKENVEDHRGAIWPRLKQEEVEEQGTTKRGKISERGTQGKDSFSKR